MNFDDALKQYLPRVWFRLKFIKYKYLGRGEPELRLIRYFVEPGTTAVDVGASIGMYSAEMARHAARVVAFEANPEVARFTRTVAARNVEVVEVALSSQAGRTTLSMPRNRRGHAVTELATIDRSHPASAGAIDIEVETRRLDDFPISNCSFVKIDVEGHEEAVLDGARSLIATQRPVLMIELVESFNPGVVARLSERCAALSYDCVFCSDGRFRPVGEFDAARDQDVTLLPKRATGRAFIANFFFVPAEKMGRMPSRLR
jgi:FkbM family methyltransferase